MSQNAARKPFRHHESWSRKRKLGQAPDRPVIAYTPPEEIQNHAKRVSLAPVGGISYAFHNGSLRKERDDDL